MASTHAGFASKVRAKTAVLAPPQSGGIFIEGRAPTSFFLRIEQTAVQFAQFVGIKISGDTINISCLTARFVSPGA